MVSRGDANGREDKRMEAIRIGRLPRLPDAHVFPQSPITAARHVAEYPVEQERGLQVPTCRFLPTVGRRHLDVRIDRSVQIGDHESGAGQPRELVD